jgi:hypothetical protein
MCMKQNRPKLDLGFVYGMYGGIGYPGYYMEPELSKEIFRFMRYYLRRLWRSTKRSLVLAVDRIPALQNLL